VGVLAPGQRTVRAGIIDFESLAPSIWQGRNPTDDYLTVRCDYDDDLVVPDTGYGYLFTSPIT